MIGLGSGRRDDDPAGEAGQGQAVPGFGLQVGEQGVIAGIAEVEGHPVDAGPQVVPLRPTLDHDVGEAGAAQDLQPVDAHPAWQPGVACHLR
jgi:hypothetical protein